MNAGHRGKLADIDIYPVTCQQLSEGRSNLEVLEGVLAGGAKIVQLREKQWTKNDIYRLALKFRKRTSESGVLFIINDHVDVALAVQADGVHLGQEDLPVRAARRIAPRLIIGVSTHSPEQALAAQEAGADYVNIGPIFRTQTKEGAKEFLGPEIIREIEPLLSIPFTIMGGITLENMHSVLQAGARRVAMVTGITKAPDIAQRVRELRAIIRSHA